MKTLLKTKIALLILLVGLAFSCKKNDTTTIDSTSDSIQTAVDTMGPEMDTTRIDTVTTQIDTIKK